MKSIIYLFLDAGGLHEINMKESKQRGIKDRRIDGVSVEMVVVTK